MGQWLFRLVFPFMPPSLTYWLQQATIALISALAYGLAFWLNDQFSEWVLFTQGVALMYLPAGVKLLALLLGGWPAALGLTAMLWGLSFAYWTQLDAWALLGCAAISIGTTWVMLTILMRAWRIGTDLTQLNFTRLLLLDALSSVTHGWLMNGYFAWLGVRDFDTLPAAAWGMALGDFVGSGLLLLALTMVLKFTRWGQLRANP